jgi:hypothetical protein
MKPYDWDPEKDRRNIAKHGVSFDDAVRIFDGRVLSWVDDRFDHGEVRQISIGTMDDALILVVVHTERRSAKHIISARPASQRERARYEAAI